jgi:bifunctional non-homologous end joining protein LigD
MPRKRNAARELPEYRAKRDFNKTSEPPPGVAPSDGRLLWIIQKHDATRLHYDFRLEFDCALKSWPIPKGPSYDPKDKRLAVMTEDHPLDYASFEGVIPKGEYGGGPVIVWDAGTYSPDEHGLFFDDREEAERQMLEGLEKGKISVFLQGQKLRGSFTLVKLAKSAKGKDWLFIKHKDRFADPDHDVIAEDASVISGLTIADLKAGRLPDRAKGRLVVRPSDALGAKKAAMPKTIEPMQATLTEHPFSDANWFFEPKMDGVRAIVFINGDSVRMVSRRGLDTTKSFPGIVKEMAEQTERHMILDGEIVALNEQGVPSFQVIQQRIGLQRPSDVAKAETEVPVYFYAFDLLYANGYDLRGSPLSDRKTLLKQLLIPTGHISLLEHFEVDGEAAYEGATAAGLEGVMAKKKDSVYENRRSKAWLKVKNTNQDEFIIGGYSSGGGTRAKTFGALLVGQYRDGKLVYSGNVGTGFNEKTLASLLKQLRELETSKKPFDVMTEGSMRFGRPKGETEVHWVKPELVAAVRFAEWTNDGHLRAPSFLGLRTDKTPKDVHREEVVPPPGEEKKSRRKGKARGRSADPMLDEVLEQLSKPVEKMNLVVGDEKLPVSNLDKPLWPEWEKTRSLTKRDLLTYFARVSPYLLPQMRDRPITLTRYPNGIHDSHFYQKHFEAKIPRFVEVTTVWSGDKQEDQEYILCNNLPTLLWLGQLADIELHTWYSRVAAEPDAFDLPVYTKGGEKKFDASRLNHPDYIVFDLDPYIYSGEEKKGAEPELNRKAFLKTCDVAFWLKELLDGMSLSSFVKTTGKTGLHIYVPILRQFDYDTVRSAAETIGRFLVRAHPRDITMEWSVPKRAGKIFFDHNQNTKGKTLASIYSPRPVAWAGVSMPVRWDQLRETYPTHFTILNAVEHVEEMGGDLWATILEEKHDLGALLEAVED